MALIGVQGHFEMWPEGTGNRTTNQYRTTCHINYGNRAQCDSLEADASVIVAKKLLLILPCFNVESAMCVCMTEIKVFK